MVRVHIKQREAMRSHSALLPKKAQLALFLALMTQLTCDTHAAAANCCTRKPHTCTLYELLCRAGHRDLTDPNGKLGWLSSDAAAGILTLGKRKATETRYQDRLQHLLHSSRNQAAGILTMGKRAGVEAGPLNDQTPANLDLDRPLKYLIQPVDRDSYTH